SISLATVTPSLVMRGAPNDFSITTLRPFGPRVTFTASARMLTPRSIRSRASDWNLTSLAAIAVLLGMVWMGEAISADDAEDVAFLHDQQLFAVQRDFGARPFAEQHAVARLHRRGDQLARILARTLADRDDLALGGFFLGGIGDDQPALGLFLGLDATDQNAVMQRFESHL